MKVREREEREGAGEIGRRLEEGRGRATIRRREGEIEIKRETDRQTDRIYCSLHMPCSTGIHCVPQGCTPRTAFSTSMPPRFHVMD